jgi:hypothetical protein
MGIRAATLVVLLLVAAGAAGETIYKYRHADGRTLYSSQRLPGLELIEIFEYRFAPSAAQPPDARDAARRADERIRQHIEALNAAWTEVRDAEGALAEAEARQRAGVEPLEAEGRSLVTPHTPVPTPDAAGGAQSPASPAAGGSGPAAPPAVGGPMGTHRGGGRSPEYYERQQKLEADVAEARARLEQAIRRYNALR